MILRLTQRFRAPLAEVYAWSTDFQDSDPALSRARLRTRRVLRREGGVVEMEETGVMGFPFAARFHVDLEPPHGWKADGRSNMGRTLNTYRLWPEPDGTRLEITFDLQLSGPYRLMAPFARGFILRRLSKEWEDYARAMESGRLERMGDGVPPSEPPWGPEGEGRVPTAPPALPPSASLDPSRSSPPGSSSTSPIDVYGDG